MFGLRFVYYIEAVLFNGLLADCLITMFFLCLSLEPVLKPKFVAYSKKKCQSFSKTCFYSTNCENVSFESIVDATPLSHKKACLMISSQEFYWRNVNVILLKY